ncbi:MAG: di-trans,poly-cis-decaprenylcistransferase [Solobacterium sp.]|jgi:undecaprenyl diphosphate synthase|nr:di-trans,poly-cis-decaprenylcistransferase [Solobacterium sp.]MBR3343476.1 di-trans,poly-cis-decaprenylcistransferase [Solobacterium sp.]HAE16388.1 di-trans,poly-cis-decaprenylcistransferase [Erysipelotrichaceae bacterium]
MEQCRHVAIIMDGNGRWAKAQGKPRSAGHLAGSENVRTIAIAASELGIEYLTLYAFSTENWKRSKDEVGYLMKLPAVFFDKYMKELIERGFRIRIIGELDALPPDTRAVMEKAERDSAMNTKLSLNIAMNYGSQREIALAAGAFAKDVLAGKADPDIEPEDFEKYLMTKDFPPVDLLIRTSGEQRISNYLLWQIAYAELEFVPEAWPEFTPEVLKRCLDEYYHRDRRFGGVKS